MATKIEWTESTWNPVTGCTKISSGCQNCYAERMAKRLHAMGQKNYANQFEVTLHPHTLEKPRHWKKPQMVFVNSMSDLFHEKVPLKFIQKVFDVMNSTPQHTYQVLTKRAERLAELAPKLNWSENIWMGVTVENDETVPRVDCLRKVRSVVRFLSLEPLLSSLPSLELDGIDWVIVGGESGPGARPILEEWVLEIRDLCELTGVPFFFKQWGGTNKKAAGRLLAGEVYDQMPKAA